MLKHKSFFSLSFLIVGLLFFTSCIEEGGGDNRSDNFNRTILLESIADRLIVPAYQELSTSIDVVVTANTNFQTTTDLANLNALRTAYENAYIAFQYAELYRLNPEITNRFHQRMNTFPTSVSTIMANMNASVYNLDTSTNDAAQGFPALDYLLFGIGSNDTEIINLYTGADSAKYLSYLNTVVTRMNTITTNVLSQWNSSYRDTFVASNGNTSTSSTNRLANSYLYHFERYLRENKISTPASLRTGGSVAPEKIEAYYKGDLSRVLFSHSLQASKNLFLGNTKTDQTGIGFDDYLMEIDRENLKDKIVNSYQLTKDKFDSNSNTFKSLLDANNKIYFENIRLEIQENRKNIEAEMFSFMYISSTDQGVSDGD